jgi:hypothetical protein
MRNLSALQDGIDGHMDQASAHRRQRHETGYPALSEPSRYPISRLQAQLVQFEGNPPHTSIQLRMAYDAVLEEKRGRIALSP